MSRFQTVIIKIVICLTCFGVGRYVANLYKTGVRILDTPRIHYMECLSKNCDDFVVIENIIHPDGGYRIQRFNCPIEFVPTKEDFHIIYNYRVGDSEFKPVKATFYVNNYKDLMK